jgi:RNA polymerase sigma-70 factor (ECF subfamily)
VTERDFLAERFEEHRAHLRAVAYRMLGSLSEVDDAVQEAWLRLSRVDAADIDNLGGWLTTVVARVCLDMLRSRQSRREEPFTADAPEPVATGTSGSSPEQEALLADSVGLALLVVLDRLTPAERLAFVLHDMFAVPFEEIAPIVGRSTEATRQLASRARRRVRGGGAPDPDLVRQREVVDAFLAALRGGDFEGLLAILDPDLVVRADMPVPSARRARSRRAVWAKGRSLRTPRADRGRPRNGAIGVVVAPRGRLVRALRFTIANGKITGSVIGRAARQARRVDRRLRARALRSVAFAGALLVSTFAMLSCQCRRYVRSIEPSCDDAHGTNPQITPMTQMWGPTVGQTRGIK